MTPDGWQQERYPDYDFEQMPMQVACTPSGEPAKVHLAIGERPLAAQIWEAKVGRISLYLLDTNIPENPPDFPDHHGQAIRRKPGNAPVAGKFCSASAA